MNKAEKINNMILAHKEMMIAELADLVEAASILGQEVGVMNIYMTSSDGKIRVSFFADKFPFEEGEIKEKTIELSDGKKYREWSVERGNIEFSCLLPKGA